MNKRYRGRKPGSCRRHRVLLLMVFCAAALVLWALAEVGRL